MDESQQADLHAFEGRLQEILRETERRGCKWYMVIAITLALFAYGCVELYNDFQANPSRSIAEYLLQNKWFSCSLCLLLIMVMYVNVFEKALSKSIYLQRTRKVLYDYALSCLDDGKLVLLPNPDGHEHQCQYNDDDHCLICNNEYSPENDSLCISEDEEIKEN